MDRLIGIVTALLGLGFIASPWLLHVAHNPIATTTIVAGGVIVALLGLALALPPPGPRRANRHR